MDDVERVQHEIQCISFGAKSATNPYFLLPLDAMIMDGRAIGGGVDFSERGSGSGQLVAEAYLGRLLWYRHSTRQEPRLFDA